MSALIPFAALLIMFILGMIAGGYLLDLSEGPDLRDDDCSPNYFHGCKCGVPEFSAWSHSPRSCGPK